MVPLSLSILDWALSAQKMILWGMPKPVPLILRRGDHREIGGESQVKENGRSRLAIVCMYMISID
jgi:hypothetical protein